MSDEAIIWLASGGAVIGAVAFVWYVITQRGAAQDMEIHDPDYDGGLSVVVSGGDEDDGDGDDDD